MHCTVWAEVTQMRPFRKAATGAHGWKGGLETDHQGALRVQKHTEGDRSKENRKRRKEGRIKREK